MFKKHLNRLKNLKLPRQIWNIDGACEQQKWILYRAKISLKRVKESLVYMQQASLGATCLRSEYAYGIKPRIWFQQVLTSAYLTVSASIEQGSTKHSVSRDQWHSFSIRSFEILILTSCCLSQGSATSVIVGCGKIWKHKDKNTWIKSKTVNRNNKDSPIGNYSIFTTFSWTVLRCFVTI